METKLKKHLKANGLKANWLSVKTNIEYTRLLRIINGAEPTVTEAVTISAELRQPIESLFEIKEIEHAF
jgi:predicted transcriptional regulator